MESPRKGSLVSVSCLAQLTAHMPCKLKIGGSIPLCSVLIAVFLVLALLADDDMEVVKSRGGRARDAVGRAAAAAATPAGANKRKRIQVPTVEKSSASEPDDDDDVYHEVEQKNDTIMREVAMSRNAEIAKTAKEAVTAKTKQAKKSKGAAAAAAAAGSAAAAAPSSKSN